MPRNIQTALGTFGVAAGFQSYFQSGFPFEYDQWISAAATAWAAEALARIIEPSHGWAGWSAYEGTAAKKMIAYGKSSSTPMKIRGDGEGLCSPGSVANRSCGCPDVEVAPEELPTVRSEAPEARPHRAFSFIESPCSRCWYHHGARRPQRHDTIQPMQSPLATIFDYYKTFSTLDLNAIVLHFSEPCMSISAQGVFSADNRVELAHAFGPLVDGLKARGYGRSEFVEAQAITLGETAALVRGVAVRYKLDESELERAAISYLMHRASDGWKIATMVLPN